MDGELNETEQVATEKLLQADTTLQERYQMLLAAKQAIRSQGLKHRVQIIHREFAQDTQPIATAPAKVIQRVSFFKTALRIAAVFIVVIAGYGAFQYAATSGQSVYNDNFTGYRLPVNRSNENIETLDALYNRGNYSGVVNVFLLKPQKNQKDYFLAAQSYLQLNNTRAAIGAFQQVERMNDNSSGKYFVQETDYYLMLAYIRADKVGEAETKWKKITSDPQHLFYGKAKAISNTKFTVLKWKEK